MLKFSLGLSSRGHLHFISEKKGACHLGSLFYISVR